MPKAPSPRPSSGKTKKRKTVPNKEKKLKTYSRVAVDANFFILAFAQKPQALNRFKEITERISFKLFSSPQVMNELRGPLRRHVLKVVEVIDITQKELDSYVNKAKEVVERVPQAPDLSLLILLKKIKWPMKGLWE